MEESHTYLTRHLEQCRARRKDWTEEIENQFIRIATEKGLIYHHPENHKRVIKGGALPIMKEMGLIK